MAVMDIVLILVVAGLAALVAWLLATRRAVPSVAPALPAPVVADVPEEVIARAVALAVAEANERSQRERDQAVRAAVEQVVTMGREQLGAQATAADASLAGRQDVIDRRLGEVQH